MKNTSLTAVNGLLVGHFTHDLRPTGCTVVLTPQGAVAGVIESVKAAADVYMPVTGEIIEVNEALRAEPSLANTAPLDAGWFFKVRLADSSQLAPLMSEADYQATL